MSHLLRNCWDAAEGKKSCGLYQSRYLILKFHCTFVSIYCLELFLDKLDLAKQECDIRALSTFILFAWLSENLYQHIYDNCHHCQSIRGNKSRYNITSVIGSGDTCQPSLPVLKVVINFNLHSQALEVVIKVNHHSQPWSWLQISTSIHSPGSGGDKRQQAPST